MKTCNTCKGSSKLGVDLFEIHICNDCLLSIGKLKVEDGNYDYYKNIIGNAWSSYRKPKLN